MFGNRRHKKSMERYLGKYFMTGDTIIHPLSVIETDKGKVIVSLDYSINHKNHHLESYLEDEFIEWYIMNEIPHSGYDNIKAEHLL